MGRIYEEITPALAEFIRSQRVFFVASAPLDGDGHVNCSPKGTESLAVLGPRRVAYLDYVGSGAETIAHVRENGRMLLMFCSFEGPPKIVRLHGTGRVHLPGSTAFEEMASRFKGAGARRSLVELEVQRVSDACGYGVPLMEYLGERSQMEEWAKKKGPAGVVDYLAEKNASSIDGLPAIDPPQ